MQTGIQVCLLLGRRYTPPPLQTWVKHSHRKCLWRNPFMASMWYRWTGHISVRLNNARVARLTGSKDRKAISGKSQSRGWDIPKRNPLEIEGKDAPAIQRVISCTKELSIWIFEEKWLNQKQNLMYTSMIKQGVGTQYQPSDDASDPTGPHIIGNQLSKNTQTLIATDQWEKQHVNPGAHWPWRDGSGPQVQGSSLPEIWATTSETTPNLHLAEGRGYLKWHWERLWHCWIASRRKQASRWGTWGLPGAPIWQTTVSEMLSRVQHSKDSNGSPCSNTWFAGHYIQMSALQNNIRQSAQAGMPCTMLLGRKKTPLCSRLPIQMWDLPTPFSNKIGPVTAWEAQGPRDSQPVLHRRHQARGWAESRKKTRSKRARKAWGGGGVRDQTCGRRAGKAWGRGKVRGETRCERLEKATPNKKVKTWKSNWSPNLQDRMGCSSNWDTLGHLLSGGQHRTPQCSESGPTSRRIYLPKVNLREKEDKGLPVRCTGKT